MIGVQDSADDNDTDGPCVRFAFFMPDVNGEIVCVYTEIDLQTKWCAITISGGIAKRIAMPRTPMAILQSARNSLRAGS